MGVYESMREIKKEVIQLNKVTRGIVVKVTKPYEDCPMGRLLLVTTVYDDGSVSGLNYKNEDDWTRYTIQNGDYVLSSEYNEDIL